MTTELKNSIEGFNSRLDQMGKRSLNSKIGQWKLSNQRSKKEKKEQRKKNLKIKEA